MNVSIINQDGDPIADYQINGDDEFDNIEEIAKKSAKKCAISWSRDSDGQQAYWGPSGASFRPHWYGGQKSPTPDEIRAARGDLSQAAAAALIGKPLRTWQNWEAPVGSPEHRKMDPLFFDAFIAAKKIADK